MNGNNNIYYSSYISESGRSLIGLMFMVGILFIIFFKVNNIIGMVITALILLLLLVSFFKLPLNIEVDDKRLKVGKYQVLWDQIDKVKFTIGLGKDLRNTRIIITSQIGELIILPKQYKEPIILRKEFEELCQSKNIKYIIEDRG